MKRMLAVTAAALGMMAAAHAQTTVYKCGTGSYSEKPCSNRIVRTYEAPVDFASHAGAGEIIAHRLPGESRQELALRQRRIHLAETDRNECARLDKKIPFDQERLRRSTFQEDIDQAQGSLAASRQRFNQLRC